MYRNFSRAAHANVLRAVQIEDNMQYTGHLTKN